MKGWNEMSDMARMSDTFEEMFENNGEWGRWSKYVLFQIERLNSSNEQLLDENRQIGEDLAVLKTQSQKMSEVLESCQNKIGEIQTKIAILNVKAGVWGLIGATIPAIAIFIWWAVKMK